MRLHAIPCTLQQPLSPYSCRRSSACHRLHPRRQPASPPPSPLSRHRSSIPANRQGLERRCALVFLSTFYVHCWPACSFLRFHVRC